jgi:hypothetical protein
MRVTTGEVVGRDFREKTAWQVREKLPGVNGVRRLQAKIVVGRAKAQLTMAVRTAGSGGEQIPRGFPATGHHYKSLCAISLVFAAARGAAPRDARAGRQAAAASSVCLGLAFARRFLSDREQVPAGVRPRAHRSRASSS